MANSTAFQRIQRDVLRLCATVPAGRVCTCADLGGVIDVPARHVAYIVSRLDEATRMQYPVHRRVGAGGKLPAKPSDVQALLLAEGLAVSKGSVQNLSAVLFVLSASTAKQANRAHYPPAGAALHQII